jgi:hypothetical protein
MNLTECKDLNRAIGNEIRDLLAARGYEVARSNARYDADENGGMKLSLEIVKVNRDDTTGINLGSPEALAYTRNYMYLTDHNGAPLAADAIGRETTWAGETYTFAGFRPRASKRPYLFVRSDGQRVVFPEQHPIVSALTGDAA